MPKVSIIIPCYNSEDFIAECLDSAFTQTFKDYEIIIVNDGSTDNSLEVINSCVKKYTSPPHFKIISQQNQGLVGARNNAISVATGKYILPLDSDDKIHATYLEKAVAVIEKDASVGIVFCRANFFGNLQGEWELPSYELPHILNENGIFCSALFKKDDFCKVGGYKKEMRYGLEDYELWLSLIENGAKVHKIPEILFYYRKHDKPSMIQDLNSDPLKHKQMFQLITKFHYKLFAEHRNHLLTFYKTLLRETEVLEGRRPIPFFTKEKTLEHKIYHIGKFKFKFKKRQNKHTSI